MSDEWQVPGFTQIRELGRGGGGTVVQATDDAGTPVAIKYLSDEMLADDGFRTAFRTEAELLAGLNTPHVTRLFEYVEGARGAAIVMELVDGTSLRATLAEHGPTEPEAALSVLKGSLLGLGAAHRAGVVHRDYKPENVLVTPDGDSKLVDFGIATRSGGAGDGAGTPAYMPPEQWAGGAASTRGDIYSATVTFAEALTGHPPFTADDFIALRELHEHAPAPVEELPEPVRGLVARGLAKDPAERPLDAQDFLVQLEHAAVTGYGPDWEERGRDSLARRAALLALLSADAVGAAGSTAVASSTLGRLGRASRRPAAVAAVGLVLAAGLATVAVTSPTRTGVPSIGQTTFPQRIAVQPGGISSGPLDGSAPAGPPNAPVPAGPSRGGGAGVKPPARGEPAGEAGGGGAPPQVVVLPSPPGQVYRPGPADVYTGPDRHEDRERRRDDGPGRRPGNGGSTPPPTSDGGTGTRGDGGSAPPHIPGGTDGKKTDPGYPKLPRYPRDDNTKTGDASTKRPRHPGGGTGRGSHPGHGDSADSGPTSKDPGDSGSHDSDNKRSDDSGPVVK
ncbi:MAG TPA: protein kinase [Pseudonocardia sp.]|nr:protein kinase [Pseudonocardia sp.]